MKDPNKRLAVKARQEARRLAAEGDIAGSLMFSDAARLEGMRKRAQFQLFCDFLDDKDTGYDKQDRTTRSHSHL